MMGQPFAQAAPIRPVRNMQIRYDQIEVLFFKQGAGFTNVFLPSVRDDRGHAE